MTLKDVADHLLVSWDTLKEIQTKHLKRRFGKPSFTSSSRSPSMKSTSAKDTVT